ncbi:MAG TPA: 50S ribosomal protein L29 [Chloroflexaceae bacterium]|nr:50S ribosomal protein L29 [Chloroflexaceae bacterium]
MATASELRDLKETELRDQLKGYYEELFNLRFQKVTGRLTNTARPRQVKKEIARIKTVLRERDLGQE